MRYNLFTILLFLCINPMNAQKYLAVKTTSGTEYFKTADIDSIIFTKEFPTNRHFYYGLDGWTASGFRNTVASYNGKAYATEAYAGWTYPTTDKAYSLKQTVTLSKGTYILSCNAFFREGISYDTDSLTSHAKLVAGSRSVTIRTLASESFYIPNSQYAAANVFADGLYLNTLKFTVEEDSASVEIGVEGTFDDNYSWCAVGAFSITETSSEPEGIIEDHIMNADLSDDLKYWTVSNFNIPIASSDAKAYATEAYAGWSSCTVDSYSIKQSIKLSAGKYRLECYAFYREGQFYNSYPETSRGNLVAGDNSVEIKTLWLGKSSSPFPNTQQEAADGFANGDFLNTLDFTIDKDDTIIDIGISGTFTRSRSWCAVGPFKLTKL